MKSIVRSSNTRSAVVLATSRVIRSLPTKVQSVVELPSSRFPPAFMTHREPPLQPVDPRQCVRQRQSAASNPPREHNTSCFATESLRAFEMAVSICSTARTTRVVGDSGALSPHS